MNLTSKLQTMAGTATPQGLVDPLGAALSSKVNTAEVASYAEMRRILGCPIVMPMTGPEIEAYSHDRIQGAAWDKGFRFFPIQAEAVAAYEMYGGLFAPAGVGWGKTLMTLMMANVDYQLGLRKLMLLVPSNVHAQLTKKDIAWARNRVAISYPIFALGDRPASYRRAVANSDKSGLYIFPYSLLSAKDAEEILHLINPDALYVDEAQNVGRRSARTSRFNRYINERKPKPKVGALSGTITAKSVKDYYQLIKAAVGDYSPLPLSSSMANEWAAVIDASAGWSEGAQTSSPLTPLIQWAREKFPNEVLKDDIGGFRRAYSLRLTTTPGVVASGDAEIGTSLIFCNQSRKRKPGDVWLDKYPEPWAEAQWSQLTHLQKQVEEAWLTPNGDEIEHAIHTWKWLYELTAGFYNELVWPTKDVYATRKSISVDEAEEIIQKAKDHHGALQGYHSTLRSWLQVRPRPGMDTPMLVGNEMARHGAKNVGQELYDAWRYAKSLEFEGMPTRDARAVRVCGYKIDEAVRWALELKKGAVMWIYHQEIGRWLVDALKEAGCERPVLHCPAGSRHNETIIDHQYKDHIIVASMVAHGTGKNLQHFSEQLYVQWPRPATQAEQCLGRIHRNGQEADEIQVNMLNLTEFDDLNFAACLNDALYIHQTTGNRQKLIYGSYNPLPRIFPSSVLIERGLEAKRLSRQQQEILEEKFG